MGRKRYIKATRVNMNKVASKQYPMIVLISVPVAPRRGRAQKGWMVLVSTSPAVKAITTRLKATPNLFAARIMIGPWTIQIPPEEGMNILMTPELIMVINGNKKGVDMATNHSATTLRSPV